MTERCPTCPGPQWPQVLSTGPWPSPFLFLGAGPAKTENDTLIPYTGLAGEELTKTYLGYAGLSRDEVHIGNCRLCWNGQDRTPSHKECLNCARCHLPALLDRVKPQLVVLMGGAAQAVADRKLRLDMYHGTPQWTSLLGGAWEGWVWPSYEPALGMRSTREMTPLLTDFRHLGKWIRGEWAPPKWDPSIEKDYRRGHTRTAVEDYFAQYL